MLLYNFRGQIIDLSTFTELKYFDGSIPVLNDGDFYHTYNDIKNYIDGDEYYKSIEKEFNNIESFLSIPFFKIYNKITDLKIFKSLFLDIVKDSIFIKAFKSAEVIQNFVLNPSVKSFLQYNRDFRILSANSKYKKYITDHYSTFNFKENYATFRISNSFLNISNTEFIETLYLKKRDRALFEIDIKASDWLWILYLNFLMTKNSELAKKIIDTGVYNQIKVFENKTHSEEKLSILASMYSLNDANKMSKIQADIITTIDIVKFIDYIVNNKSIQLVNGFYRTKKYNIAYYGQTATSIFLTRFLFTAFYEYIREYGGEVLFTKHDSIIFEAPDDFKFNINTLKLDIIGIYLNFCGKDIQISEKMKKILYLFIQNNYNLNKLS